jgi:4-hydroxy-2-oxoheptanedioate aldolase
MKQFAFAAAVVALAFTGYTVTVPVRAQSSSYKPKRINKAIELLEQGQPIYYTTVTGGAGYEEGKKMAQTWADYITYEMEHGSLDFTALREFMRGLVDGGPTRSGHRTPAVVATLPVLGISKAHMEANFWVVQQALLSGAHGILLCHARDPEAIKEFVRACRYPNAQPVVPQLGEGLRRRIHEESRPVAAQPQRRIFPRAEDRRQTRFGQRRESSRRPGYRVCRMGPWRHGHLAQPA